MLTDFLVLKIVISLVIVFGLTFLAERVSTRFAGILMAFPLSTAIILFFIGLQNGEEFAAKTSLWAINGLVAEIIFMVCYYWGVLFFRKWSVILTSLLAFSGFALSAFFIRMVPFYAPLQSSFFLLTFMTISFFIFKRIENVNIQNPLEASQKTVFYRGMVVTVAVVAITWLSEVLGPEWSGILASTPLNIFLVLIFVQRSYQPEHVCTLIRGYPAGLLSLLLYLLAVYYLYPVLGIILGTVISYLIAGIYIVFFEIGTRRSL